MRLEDALLFVVFDAGALSGSNINELASDAIGVGADLVGLKFPQGSADKALLESVGSVCREEDALFVVWDDPFLAQEIGADGIHLSTPDGSMGEARAVAGIDGMVGVSTANAEEAVLAAEVGADYIIHSEGVMCASTFAQMRGSGLANLYAAGLASIDEARQIVGNGVFRICIEVNCEEQARPDVIAEYSRLFGRVI